MLKVRFREVDPSWYNEENEGKREREKGKAGNEKNFKRIVLRKHRESIHPSTVGMIDQVNLVRHGSCHGYIRLNPFPASGQIDPPFISLMDRWWNLGAPSKTAPRCLCSFLPVLVYFTMYICTWWVDNNIWELSQVNGAPRFFVYLCGINFLVLNI